MARPQVYTNDEIISALVEKKGLVYLAAKRLACSPNTIYARARTSPAVAEAIASQRGEVVDTAEMKLFEAIEAREAWAIALTLKTLGKDRGYVERQEMTGADGLPLFTADDLDAIEKKARQRREAEERADREQA
jgi:hypothetical protein